MGGLNRINVFRTFGSYVKVLLYKVNLLMLGPNSAFWHRLWILTFYSDVELNLDHAMSLAYTLAQISVRPIRYIKTLCSYF